MKSNLDTPVARFFDIASWYALCGLGWIAGAVGVFAVLGILYMILGGILQCFGIHILPDMSGMHSGCTSRMVGKMIVCN